MVSGFLAKTVVSRRAKSRAHLHHPELASRSQCRSAETSVTTKISGHISLPSMGMHLSSWSAIGVRDSGAVCSPKMQWWSLFARADLYVPVVSLPCNVRRHALSQKRCRTGFCHRHLVSRQEAGLRCIKNKHSTRTGTASSIASSSLESCHSIASSKVTFTRRVIEL